VEHWLPVIVSLVSLTVEKSSAGKLSFLEAHATDISRHAESCRESADRRRVSCHEHEPLLTRLGLGLIVG